MLSSLVSGHRINIIGCLSLGEFRVLVRNEFHLGDFEEWFDARLKRRKNVFLMRKCGLSKMEKQQVDD